MLVIAGYIALLCAVVNAAALTDREKTLIEQLADELHYQETHKETPENAHEQGMYLLSAATKLRKKLTLVVLVQ